MSFKGIEKAFEINEEKHKDDQSNRVKLISNFEECFNANMHKMESIFDQCMNMLNSANHHQQSLKLLIKEKENQNKFWEKTNEDIEHKLNEVDFQKTDLEEQCRKMVRQEAEFKNELKRRDTVVLEKENEIFLKEKEIEKLQRWIKESNERVTLMEDETKMVKQKQKETVENLKIVKEENNIEIRNIDRECLHLKETNNFLQKQLDKELNEKKILYQELRDMQLKIESKEIELKAALGKNGNCDLGSDFQQSTKTLKHISLIQLFPNKTQTDKNESEGFFIIFTNKRLF